MTSTAHDWAGAFTPAAAPVAERLRRYPLVGLLPELRRDPLRVFVELMRDRGDIVEIDLGLKKVLMLNHPFYIRHVFQDNHLNYRKSKFYGPLKPILGGGIFMSEGEEWLEQRKTLSSGFQGACLRSMVRDMAEATAEMIDRWSAYEASGTPIDIVPEMMRLTLDVVMRCMFGVRFRGEHAAISHALATTLRDAERRIWSVIAAPRCLPTPRNLRYRKALQVLDEFVRRIIEERRREAFRRDDLLQTLLDTYGSDAAQCPAGRLLRDQVLSIILAGHETTANALSWAWYLLSKHPDMGRRLTEEVKRLLGGRPPSFEDIGALRFTRMVFDETLRLYPPVWTVSRTAVADDRIGALPVPAGSHVMLCAYAVHRHPMLWPNPEGFDPERFDPERARERPRYALFPFGGGPRACLGARFGTLEAIVVLAMVSQAFRLDLLPGHPVEPEPMITLRPRYGVPVRLSRL